MVALLRPIGIAQSTMVIVITMSRAGIHISRDRLIGGIGPVMTGGATKSIINVARIDVRNVERRNAGITGVIDS